MGHIYIFVDKMGLDEMNIGFHQGEGGKGKYIEKLSST